MSKRILVTGAASGFGRGAALELAKRGHSVIAGVQIAPQKTGLMQAADDAGVKRLGPPNTASSSTTVTIKQTTLATAPREVSIFPQSLSWRSSPRAATPIISSGPEERGGNAEDLEGDNG